MFIKEVIIENYRCFEGRFSLTLNRGLNILVGNNDVGKSTILEAIHLALTGWINGRHLRTELSEFLFNKRVVAGYLKGLKDGSNSPPPSVLIELFFEIEDDALKNQFHGNGNSEQKDECGIQFKIFFNVDKYKEEYEQLIQAGGEIQSLPIEYYDFSWASFARDESVTPRSIPIKAAMIDSSNSRYQNGSDIYISRIIRDRLETDQIVKISQAHRKLRDSFEQEEAVQSINKMLEDDNISEKEVKISVDMSTKTAWETSLMTYLDEIPFSFTGKGEQSLVKTKLALSGTQSEKASLLLMEEPENHLSHSNLNKFIKYIERVADKKQKQVIVSTHSSFVANKLGLGNLILLNVGSAEERILKRIDDLDETIRSYFKKLAGYDTLRLLLCERAVLVEGPSDELIVQKAYLQKKDKLPIEDGVDVISVGTSSKRFLEVSKKIEKPTAAVIDNDGDYENNVTERYKDYENLEHIEIFADNNNELETLEPQVVAANRERLDVLRTVLGINDQEYSDEQSIVEYMKNNKTDCALKIFETEEDVQFPEYISQAVGWAYGEE